MFVLSSFDCKMRRTAPAKRPSRPHGIRLTPLHAGYLRPAGGFDETHKIDSFSFQVLTSFLQLRQAHPNTLKNCLVETHAFILKCPACESIEIRVRPPKSSQFDQKQAYILYIRVYMPLRFFLLHCKEVIGLHRSARTACYGPKLVNHVNTGTEWQQKQKHVWVEGCRQLLEDWHPSL